MKKIKILVLYGGFSEEKKVSEKTGNAIINSLNQTDMIVIPLYVKEGFIKDLINIDFDIAIIALHGKYGEDGTIQGLLDLMNKPYIGSGVLSSAVCMDKIATKHILKSNKINTPDFTILKNIKDIEKNNLKYPIVLKPVDEGSSIGMKLLNNESELKKSLNSFLNKYGKMIAEEYIEGIEITIPIIKKNKKLRTLEIIEIVPENNFFDYECKYIKGKTNYILPARIDEKLSEKIKSLSLKIFNIMECEDYARVDMIIQKETNKIFVLEINTLPGMTETSLLPMAAQYENIDFKNLLLILLNNYYG